MGYSCAILGAIRRMTKAPAILFLSDSGWFDLTPRLGLTHRSDLPERVGQSGQGHPRNRLLQAWVL